MYKPFKMKGKSPLAKKLVGKQHNLPEHLKAKIKAAPESPSKMMGDDDKKKKAKAAKAKAEAKAKKSYYGASNYPGGPSNPFADEMSVVGKDKKKKKTPNKKYKSDAQRKAVHASKAESAMKKKGCKSAYKKYDEDSAMKMYKNKRNKSNKPCAGCKSICPSCRGKK